LSLTVLAIDTCMAACSAAAWRDGILAHRMEPMERGHAERIAPMVREVMAKAGLGFDKLDRIAVTVGPGTFTGQRIGLAMARGLGLARQIPVIGITTLEAIASANAEAGAAIAVACDARRGEAYFAAYTDGLQPLHDTSLLPLDIIAKRLPAGKTRVAGSAADALIALVGRSEVQRVRGHDLPDAADVARLAVGRPATRELPEPLYLRPPDAKPKSGSFLPPSITIRRVGIEEVGTIARLHAACFDEPWDAAAIIALLAAPGSSAWLAENRGAPWGFILARRAVDEVEILSFGTKPAARRRGVARRLLKTVIDAHKDASAIFIEVAADNDAARSLYASFGFVEAGRRAAYYSRRNGKRVDAVVMRKGLGA
jgi:tRNA threonylcarbamoyladenosine biosynthesis protein TsaB